MKKSIKSALCVAASAIMLFGSACGGNGNRGNGGSSKDTLRIFTYSGHEFESVMMDSVMKSIEEKLDIKFAFEGATAADYYTKLNPMISTGDFPDILWSDPENSSGAFQTWADPKQDILWNLDDLLAGKSDRYPYLTKLIYSDQYKNIMYHGGHYIVPHVSTSTAWAIYYRADWLEAIGFVDEDGKAKAPTTLDEFEYVMKSFSGKDLFTDAHGKKSGQTYGISPNTQNFYVNPLYGAFGITPDWDITDSGEVSYMYAREEFKPYLKWMNAMYKKGWIDPTFNQNTEFKDRDAWYNGKVGCIMTNGEGHMEWVIGNFESSQGADKVIVGPPLVGTGNVSADTGCTLGVEGEKGYSNWGGYYGGYAITKETKDPHKALDLLEYLVSEEGAELRLYGIEGTHYTKDANGNVTADITGRMNERVQYFSEVSNADGTSTCAGLHQIGGRFGYALDWKYFDETGKVQVSTDIGSLSPKFGSLVRQAIEYTKDLQTPKLLNVTAYPSTIDTQKAECMKIASAFINRAIVGTSNLEEDWKSMLNDLDKAGYKTVKAVMQETAIELGIIEG